MWVFASRRYHVVESCGVDLRDSYTFTIESRMPRANGSCKNCCGAKLSAGEDRVEEAF